MRVHLLGGVRAGRRLVGVKHSVKVAANCGVGGSPGRIMSSGESL